MDTSADSKCCLCNSPAKYRCPSCFRHTCSLQCVTAHKKTYSCSGRKQPVYIPVSDMTTSTLSSDVALLDEVSRVLESTSRAFIKRQLDANTTANKHVKTTLLRKCCAERHIQLLLCPSILSRRVRNYTIIRKNNMYWTLEWFFPDVDIVLFERRVNERVNLKQSLERALERASNTVGTAEMLQEYRNTDDVTVLLRDLDSPNSAPKYFLCDLESSLRSNLENSKVLEYPRLVIVLKRDFDKYIIVERRDVQVQVKSDTHGGNLNHLAAVTPEEEKRDVPVDSLSIP
ncbi:box C D snoRNA 1-like, putative [Babesia ovis]|uniref:Box C D snoRNA 1-like, putative n=1 Tax=Babesia ovis TaxID=5869 RepID=A0A9W5TA81_BABOV|nr:box C D snoRNA 1-like, putative [Babesia ovis]